VQIAQTGGVGVGKIVLDAAVRDHLPVNAAAAILRLNTLTWSIGPTILSAGARRILACT